MGQVYSQQIVGVGVNDFIVTQVDPTHQAVRESMRPFDHVGQGVIGGHYLMGFNFSNTAAKPAGGSDIVSLRWTDTKFLFLLLKLQVWITTTAVYTATLNQDLALFIARNFSVSPSGGTQIIPLAGGQRVRSSNMKNSGLDGTSGVLWASSGDLLTTGTRTLDTQYIGYGAYQNAITTPNAPSLVTLYDNTDQGQHPEILGPNEGLVMQTPIGNGQAAGVSKYAFIMKYAEIPAY